MQLSSLRALLMSMTLEEKIGQLTQLPASYYSLNMANEQPSITPSLASDIAKLSGSTYDVSGAKELRAIQQAYVQNHRLGIPLLFIADVRCGYRTTFPNALAMAASWQPTLMQESAQVIARECYVAGLHAIFTPHMELAKPSALDQVGSGFGQELCLYARMMEATIAGLQGATLASDRVAACAQPFFGEQEIVDEQALAQNIELNRLAVAAGVKLVMSSTYSVYGQPIITNTTILKDLLRRKWGFEGLVISSFNALANLIDNQDALTAQEVVKQAIKAGLDVDRCSLTYAQHLSTLVETGAINEVLIDAAVWRILLLKNDLGLFENPYRGADELRESKLLLCKEHQKVALQMANQSLVLLKNAGELLPLLPELTLGLVGLQDGALEHPSVAAWQDNLEPAPTLRQALAAYFDEIISLEGRQSLAHLAAAHVIIIILKPSKEHTGEYVIPLSQKKLLKDCKKLGKPVVGLLATQFPLDLTEVIEFLDALLVTWLGGHQEAIAIAQTLVGVNNPSAKLPISFPYKQSNLASMASDHVADDQANTGRSLDLMMVGVTFPFGFGLSYSRFVYKDVALSSKIMRKNESINLTLTVVNDSKYEGKEVVQLYVQVENSRETCKLIDFKKIKILPQRGEQIIFVINQAMLFSADSRLNQANSYTFELLVGASSQQGQRCRLSWKA